MGRSARKILASLFLGLYGLLSVSGPSLHAIPAFDHAKAAHGETTSDPGRPDNLPHPHDDCLVCHFLTLGQIHHDRASQGDSAPVSTQPASELSLLLPQASLLSAHPRAPPSA